jgi:hypothetical protein
VRAHLLAVGQAKHYVGLVARDRAHADRCDELDPVTLRLRDELESKLSSAHPIVCPGSCLIRSVTRAWPPKALRSMITASIPSRAAENSPLPSSVTAATL